MMDRDYLEDLEIMFDQYKRIKTSVNTNSSYFDKYGNQIASLYHQFFVYIMQYYKRNGFPKVVSDQMYKNLYINELYHGFSEYEYGANMLVDWNVHYGIGYQTHGFHMTKDKKYAFGYTKNADLFEAKSYGRVMQTMSK